MHMRSWRAHGACQSNASRPALQTAPPRPGGPARGPQTALDPSDAERARYLRLLAEFEGRMEEYRAHQEEAMQRIMQAGPLES